MKKAHLFWILALSLSLLSTACNGPVRPANFPKVVPFSIVINNDGSPIDEVRVLLVSDKADVAWGVSGLTNHSGQSYLLTSQGAYSRKGCPEGKYKVILSRVLLTGLELSEEEYLKLSGDEIDVYSARIEDARRKQPRIIPSSFSSVATTPLEIDVVGSKTSYEIELADYK